MDRLAHDHVIFMLKHNVYHVIFILQHIMVYFPPFMDGLAHVDHAVVHPRVELFEVLHNLLPFGRERQNN